MCCEVTKNSVFPTINIWLGWRIVKAYGNINCCLTEAPTNNQRGNDSAALITHQQCLAQGYTMQFHQGSNPQPNESESTSF